MKTYKAQIFYSKYYVFHVLVYYNILTHKIYLKKTNNIKQYILHVLVRIVR